VDVVAISATGEVVLDDKVFCHWTGVVPGEAPGWCGAGYTKGPL